jgi:hypothetical protein
MQQQPSVTSITVTREQYAHMVGTYLLSLMNNDTLPQEETPSVVSDQTAFRRCRYADQFIFPSLPNVTLNSYCASLCRHMDTDSSMMIYAAVLLRRISTQRTTHSHESGNECPANVTAVRLTPYNIHALTCCAFITAVKMCSDQFLALSVYSRIGRFTTSAAELFRFEFAFCALLNFSPHVERDEWSDVKQSIDSLYVSSPVS